MVCIYHLMWETLGIGIICGLNAFMMGIILYKSIKIQHVYWPQNIIAVVMTISIIYGTYELGYRGVIYIFPFTLSLFFHLPFRKALCASLLLVIGGLIAALHTMTVKLVLLLTIPIIITVTLSCMYAISVTKHKRELEYEAKQDYLTGIANRRNIMTWINKKLAILSYPTTLSIFYIDIDDFKRINDTYGNTVGDQVLQEVGTRIEAICTLPIFDESRKIGPIRVARIASDEFVLVNIDLHTEEKLRYIARVLIEKISETMCIRDNYIKINVSVGVSSSRTKNTDANHLMIQADQAMFKAKNQGKNQTVLHDSHLAKELERNNLILKALRTAIDDKSFFLTFMPIYNREKKLIGAEALIRTLDTELSLHGPDKYIPIAEKIGLIKDIDLFVIEESFIKMQTLLPSLKDNEFTLAINISALELRNKDFPSQVAGLAKKYSIKPHYIEFEITETSLVDHDKKSTELLIQLKNQGFKLALDDFGTGYTAFNQLQNYPVDTLKIDRMFVSNISKNNQDNGSMIDVILSLAKLYKLNVIAEGVEENYQMDYLLAKDCAQYQGYLLSKPVAWEKLIEMLNS